MLAVLIVSRITNDKRKTAIILAKSASARIMLTRIESKNKIKPITVLGACLLTSYFNAGEENKKIK